VLTHIHPYTRWLTSKGAPLFPGPTCPGTPGAAKCPEPLCPIKVLPRSPWSRRTPSADVTLPSSLLRAHAPILHPPRASGVPSHTRSLQVAVSPCWEEDLPGVRSATLSLRAWTPTPAALVVHLPVSSHKTTAFATLGTARRQATPVQQLQYGALFRGCSHSLMFRPAGLLAIQVAPTAVPCDTRQPWLLRPRLFRFVTSPNRGYANRPFRATDGRGTCTLLDSQPCRLLPERCASGAPGSRSEAEAVRRRPASV